LVICGGNHDLLKSNLYVPKSSKLQCKKAALKGKYVCMFHGGKSTGPVTSFGKKRCAEAKTIHGRETRVIRNVRAKKLAELKFY